MPSELARGRGGTGEDRLGLGEDEVCGAGVSSLQLRRAQPLEGFHVHILGLAVMQGVQRLHARECVPNRLQDLGRWLCPR